MLVEVLAIGPSTGVEVSQERPKLLLGPWLFLSRQFYCALRHYSGSDTGNKFEKGERVGLSSTLSRLTPFLGYGSTTTVQV